MASSNELKRLKSEAEKIWQSCQSWKECRDGSYEMALDARGYYKTLDKIEKLKGEL